MSRAFVNVSGDSGAGPMQRPRTAMPSRGGKTTTGSVIPPPILLCNLCTKQLATTCYLCACDCVFCEACTYSHFEKSSTCPTCGKGLTESDFREVNVVEASKTHPIDNLQAGYQTLFTRLSSKMQGALPLSDLCYSAIKQLDASKQSIKFVLKQLLLESTNAKKKIFSIQRAHEQLKKEATKWKQSHSTEKLQLEKINNELQQRLQSRDATIRELNEKLAEQERMLNQFQKLHGPQNSLGRSQITNSANAAGITSSRSFHQFNDERGQQQSQRLSQPPLQGFIMQKEARDQQRQESYTAARQPRIIVGRPTHSSSNMSHQASVQLTHHTSDSALMMLPPDRLNTIHNQQRPFSTMSGSSSASLSNTPRIRDLSSRSEFVFTSSSYTANNHNSRTMGMAGVGHINKRRRANPIRNTVLSPTTGFARSWNNGGGRPGAS